MAHLRSHMNWGIFCLSVSLYGGGGGGGGRVCGGGSAYWAEAIAGIAATSIAKRRRQWEITRRVSSRSRRLSTGVAWGTEHAYIRHVFEFDPVKSATNKDKHGIDFVEAQALWDDQQAVRLEVPRPGLTEDRWLIVGRIGDRLWTAVVTYRGTMTRIISVRRARADEEARYG